MSRGAHVRPLLPNRKPKVYRERIRSSLLSPQSALRRGGKHPNQTPARCQPQPKQQQWRASPRSWPPRRSSPSPPQPRPRPRPPARSASASAPPSSRARRASSRGAGARSGASTRCVRCVSLLCPWLLPDARGATASWASHSVRCGAD